MQNQLNQFYSGVVLLISSVLLAIFQFVLTAQSQFEQGLELYQQGEYPEAELAFREAIDRNQDQADAYYYLGLTLSQQDQLKQAVAAYQKSLAFVPIDAAHRALGLALYDQGKKQEGITHLKQASDLAKVQRNVDLRQRVDQALQKLEAQ